ncbi:MAG: hypothetical protein WA359_04540 [Acidimicrobiales bacterium]
MTTKVRTVVCSDREARLRLKAARAYLEAAELILTDAREEFASVAAGNAILAGIAATDALCGKGLGLRSRDKDHRQAAEPVKTASSRGTRHKTLLIRLLDVKDEAHYGFLDVSTSTATRAVNSARELVNAAIEFLQR